MPTTIAIAPPKAIATERSPFADALRPVSWWHSFTALLRRLGSGATATKIETDRTSADLNPVELQEVDDALRLWVGAGKSKASTSPAGAR